MRTTKTRHSRTVVVAALGCAPLAFTLAPGCSGQNEDRQPPLRTSSSQLETPGGFPLTSATQFFGAGDIAVRGETGRLVDFNSLIDTSRLPPLTSLPGGQNEDLQLAGAPLALLEFHAANASDPNSYAVLTTTYPGNKTQTAFSPQTGLPLFANSDWVIQNANAVTGSAIVAFNSTGLRVTFGYWPSTSSALPTQADIVVGGTVYPFATYTWDADGWLSQVVQTVYTGGAAAARTWTIAKPAANSTPGATSLGQISLTAEDNTHYVISTYNIASSWINGAAGSTSQPVLLTSSEMVESEGNTEEAAGVASFIALPDGNYQKIAYSVSDPLSGVNDAEIIDSIQFNQGTNWTVANVDMTGMGPWVSWTRTLSADGKTATELVQDKAGGDAEEWKYQVAGSLYDGLTADSPLGNGSTTLAYSASDTVRVAPISVTNSDGSTVALSYDGRYDVTSETDTSPATGGIARVIAMSNTYDAIGRLSATSTSWNGIAVGGSSYVYDSAVAGWSLTSESDLTPGGTVFSTTIATSPQTGSIVRTITESIDGTPRKVTTTPDGRVLGFDSNGGGIAVTYSYGANALLLGSSMTMKGTTLGSSQYSYGDKNHPYVPTQVATTRAPLTLGATMQLNPSSGFPTFVTNTASSSQVLGGGTYRTTAVSQGNGALPGAYSSWTTDTQYVTPVPNATFETGATSGGPTASSQQTKCFVVDNSCPASGDASTCWLLKLFCDATCSRAYVLVVKGVPLPDSIGTPSRVSSCLIGGDGNPDAGQPPDDGGANGAPDSGSSGPTDAALDVWTTDAGSVSSSSSSSGGGSSTGSSSSGGSGSGGSSSGTGSGSGGSSSGSSGASGGGSSSGAEMDSGSSGTCTVQGYYTTCSNYGINAGQCDCAVFLGLGSGPRCFCNVIPDGGFSVPGSGGVDAGNCGLGGFVQTNSCDGGTDGGDGGDGGDGSPTDASSSAPDATTIMSPPVTG
jgi:YD repeat-containing protein